jgi:hypothetical protein
VPCIIIFSFTALVIEIAAGENGKPLFALRNVVQDQLLLWRMMRLEDRLVWYLHMKSLGQRPDFICGLGGRAASLGARFASPSCASRAAPILCRNGGAFVLTTGKIMY